MFDDLIQSESVEVRGREFVLHEIGAGDWVERVMQEEADMPEGQERSLRDLARGNRDFAARLIGCSLARSYPETPVDKLIAEAAALPNQVQDALFEVAYRVNGLDKHDPKKADGPAGDSATD